MFVGRRPMLVIRLAACPLTRQRFAILDLYYANEIFFFFVLFVLSIVQMREQGPAGRQACLAIQAPVFPPHHTTSGLGTYFFVSCVCSCLRSVGKCAMSVARSGVPPYQPISQLLSYVDTPTSHRRPKLALGKNKFVPIQCTEITPRITATFYEKSQVCNQSHFGHRSRGCAPQLA